MLETDTEKNSSYGSKPALPRAGEQKKRACEEFQYDFSNGTKRSEARPEETYFYGENQPMMFEEAVKAKSGGGSKNAEKGLAVFLTVAAMLPGLGKGADAVGKLGGLLCLAQIPVMLYTIFPTERALKKTFDKDGNRK